MKQPTSAYRSAQCEPTSTRGDYDLLLKLLTNTLHHLGAGEDHAHEYELNVWTAEKSELITTLIAA